MQHRLLEHQFQVFTTRGLPQLRCDWRAYHFLRFKKCGSHLEWHAWGSHKVKPVLFSGSTNQLMLRNRAVCLASLEDWVLPPAWLMQIPDKVIQSAQLRRHAGKTTGDTAEKSMNVLISLSYRTNRTNQHCFCWGRCQSWCSRGRCSCGADAEPMSLVGLS